MQFTTYDKFQNKIFGTIPSKSKCKTWWNCFHCQQKYVCNISCSGMRTSKLYGQTFSLYISTFIDNRVSRKIEKHVRKVSGWLELFLKRSARSRVPIMKCCVPDTVRRGLSNSYITWHRRHVGLTKKDWWSSQGEINENDIFYDDSFLSMCPL